VADGLKLRAILCKVRRVHSGTRGRNTEEGARRDSQFSDGKAYIDYGSNRESKSRYGGIRFEIGA
jgi:hypothetical protein